jgi:cellulose synthase/poly-beta-1,6-N-acetylglucosamine synthase-like glycosyltransferase
MKQPTKVSLISPGPQKLKDLLEDTVPLPTTKLSGTVLPEAEQYASWLRTNAKLPHVKINEEYRRATFSTDTHKGSVIQTFAPFDKKQTAYTVATIPQRVAFSAFVLVSLLSFFFLHLFTLVLVFGAVSVAYFIVFLLSCYIVIKSPLSSTTHIPSSLIQTLDAMNVPWPTYTILCPLFKETQVVSQLVDALRQLDYPRDKLQILLLTEEEDSATRTILQTINLPKYFTVLTIPKGIPQTKPRACNFGLLQATGQFVVIYDAEDKPTPFQLKESVLTFAKHSATTVCVQAQLNYYNSTQNLLTKWFTAEYTTWFGFLLPGLQRTKLSLPLGGTSNHFRTAVLQALGGWDAFNVTEDCDLGLRITRHCLQTVVMESTTYEEATSQLTMWLLQRSRWIKGYMQTYLVHMRNPIILIREKQYSLFFTLQLTIGLWTFVLLLNPVMWLCMIVYVIFRPAALYTMLFPGPSLYLGTFCFIFGNFFYMYLHMLGCLRRHQYSLVKWVLGIPIYWIFMSCAAYIALYQLWTKPHYWQKTQHGFHLKKVHPFLSLPLTDDPYDIVASFPTLLTPIVTHTPYSSTHQVNRIRKTLSQYFSSRWVSKKKRQPTDLYFYSTLGGAIILSVGAAFYYLINSAILLYSDAYFHLRIARRVFDSLTPGFSQLGTTWLPLPHLLMIPFIWNDYLWRTGLAGTIPAMICYIVTAGFLYKTNYRLTHCSWVSCLGSLVFLLNLNVLYLQSTPLSELVCIVTFTSTGYYFLAWLQDDRPRFLVFAATATFFATLARYDGWSLFGIFLILVPVACWFKKYSVKKIVGFSILFNTLSSFGVGLWLLWNFLLDQNPIYFENGPYSSKEQTIGLQNSHAPLYAYHNLLEAIKLYAWDVFSILGPEIFVFGLLAFCIFFFTKRVSLDSLGMLVFFAPFAFYVLALFTGDVSLLVPGAVPSGSPTLFNVRFGVEMVVPFAIGITYIIWLLTTIPIKRFKRGLQIIIALGYVILLVGNTVQVASAGVLTVEDGLYGVSCEPSSTVNSYLAQHYAGGYILEDLFSSPVDGNAGNFDFRNIIWEGSYQIWPQALKNPTVATWVVANVRSPSDLINKLVIAPSPTFTKTWQLVVQDPTGLRLYHRIGGAFAPTRPSDNYPIPNHTLCQ